MIQKFLIGILILLSSTLGISNEVIEDMSASDAATYVIENLDTLNQILDEQGFDINLSFATSYDIEIDTTYELLFGELISFNLGAFYMVIGDKLMLYGYGTDLDPKIIEKSLHHLRYHVIVGFQYIEDGTLISFAEKSDMSLEDLKAENKTYDGQQSGAIGAGKIIDTGKYIKNRYGDGWKQDSKNNIVYFLAPKGSAYTMEGFSQSALSVYNERKNGYIYSEGNCGTVSAYTAIRFIARAYHRTKYIANSNYDNYDPQVSEPNLYTRKTSDSNISINTNLYWDELYRNTRIQAYQNFGGPESLTIWQSEALMEKTMALYNVSINARVNAAWGGYVSLFHHEIDSNRPLLWSTSTNTYGSHTMAVAGYEKWSKTTGWWIFTSTEYLTFAELRDGHSTSPRYFDFNAYIGLAAFVRFEL